MGIESNGKAGRTQGQIGTVRVTMATIPDAWARLGKALELVLRGELCRTPKNHRVKRVQKPHRSADASQPGDGR